MLRTLMKPGSAVQARDAVKARRARLLGIALMCGAVSTFSCLDVASSRSSPNEEESP
jgi:hypothetical protein